MDAIEIRFVTIAMDAIEIRFVTTGNGNAICDH
jgi:hypothetical protein